MCDNHVSKGATQIMDGGNTEKGPEEVQRLKELGNEAFKQKSFGSALTYYSLALEKDPSNAALHLNRAICHGALGQWVHSKIDAQQAMEASEEYYPKAHCRLTLALVHASFFALCCDIGMAEYVLMNEGVWVVVSVLSLLLLHCYMRRSS